MMSGLYHPFNHWDSETLGFHYFFEKSHSSELILQLELKNFSEKKIFLLTTPE